MKRIPVIIPTLFILFILASCGGKDAYKITALELSLDKSKILNNDEDAINITVSDQDGKDISSRVSIMIDGNLLMGSSIVSSETGSMVVHAEYEGITSNSETITVVEDTGLEYERLVLLEQFTATWCGWCPRAITAIDDAISTDEKVVHIAYHLNGDPYFYSYNQSLADRLNVQGIPAVSANRSFFWDLSVTQLRSLYDDVRTGFEVSYTGDGSSVEVSVDVSFGIVYTEELSLTVYLVEDGLPGDQSNYYNDDVNSSWYGLGAVISDFIHDNVMMQTLTDMYGDQIPEASIDIGSIYTVEIDGSVVNLEDVNNTSAVVFVTYGSGINKGKVINAIVCDYGESVESTLID